MKCELKNFQSNALDTILKQAKDAQGSYERFGIPQVISLTAPTGSGKTIIATSFIEDTLMGNDEYVECPDSIFIWVSDSPELNEQSKLKIEAKADKLRFGQCVTVDTDSFNMEYLEDGHIYFLNTQKLSKSSKLVKGGDGRDYTIWETLQNTIEEKSDRLFVIIDEAHRGMKSRGAKEATTTMQKFIKGSEEDGLSPFPVVLGMSATIERFDALVGSVKSTTIRRVSISPSEVRKSGLLKDEVFVLYPKDVTARVDMAVLQAATDDWKKKCDHWDMFYSRQKSRRINPIFLIQVENASGSGISATDLDEVIKTIEERIGYTFTDDEVVHTFGEKTNLTINGRTVRYEEPSRIEENMSVKVVLFKDAISTGWDCPRAETMVSFRRASDATYIAQLLGRMLRTPLQQRVLSDEYLNSVYLFLPYFNKNTVDKIVKEIRDEEGGSLPADVDSGTLEDSVTLTANIPAKPAAVHKKQPKTVQKPVSEESYPLFEYMNGTEGISGSAAEKTDDGKVAEAAAAFTAEPACTENMPVKRAENEGNIPVDIASGHGEKPPVSPRYEAERGVYSGHEDGTMERVISRDDGENRVEQSAGFGGDDHAERDTRTDSGEARIGQDISSDYRDDRAERDDAESDDASDNIDRLAVIDYINNLGIQSYEVRKDKINDYLKSLFKLAGFLSQTGIYARAVADVKNDISDMINAFVTGLKASGQYDMEIAKRMEFILSAKSFDVLVESDAKDVQMDLLSTTDTDVERQFLVAEKKLKNEGVGLTYGRRFGDLSDVLAYKLDVIMFVSDIESMGKVMKYAEVKYHSLVDKYRGSIRKLSEKNRLRYRNIVNDGDSVSSHDYFLPQTIDRYPASANGTSYAKHLYVDEKTRCVKLKLNGWEDGLLKEEMGRPDFICWLRNPDRRSWSLCIPYEKNGNTESMYPDFLVIRRDGPHDYFIDILEPHDPSRNDNVGKAKGLAEYAAKGYFFGRIQIIRKTKKPTGEDGFKRLDVSRSEVRNRLRSVITNDELDKVFDDYGFFE